MQRRRPEGRVRVDRVGVREWPSKLPRLRETKAFPSPVINTFMRLVIHKSYPICFLNYK